MKKELEDRLIATLMPVIYPEHLDEAKMLITMALNGFDICKSQNEIVVYEGDVNELILNRFLLAKTARGLSPNTLREYRNTIRKALATINKPYNEITSDDIRMYLAIRVQRDRISKRSANNERRDLSAFYTWLQKEEILLKNPMNKVEAVKETRLKKHAFSQMDLEKIRGACTTPRETALIEILISTWCRISEVVNMKTYDIDGNRISVIGKGDKEREVFLSPKAQLAIQNYMDQRSDYNPYLFPRAKYAGEIGRIAKGGRSTSRMWYTKPDMVGEGPCDKGSLESIIRTIGKRAGVPNTHPHRFRRTGATMALRSGMPILTVSKMMGHENINTTQIYLDISDKELEQAHEKFVV